MGLAPFAPDNTIFKNETALRDSYRPDELLERDEELAAYQSALRPVINGAQPKNIFLYGETGVGKTLATRMVLDRLRQDQADYDHLDLHTVNLVCKSMGSSYQVAVNLVNEFRDPHEEINSTGHPASDVYNKLWTHLEELNATHCLIVLDEIDAIGSDDNLLYELPRANDNGNVESTWVALSVSRTTLRSGRASVRASQIASATRRFTSRPMTRTNSAKSSPNAPRTPSATTCSAATSSLSALPKPPKSMGVHGRH